MNPIYFTIMKDIASSERTKPEIKVLRKVTYLILVQTYLNKLLIMDHVIRETQ